MSEDKVMTLGQTIGSIKQALSVKNDAGEVVKLSVKIDFTNSTNQEIKGWLASNRTIAGQRPWRKLSKAEIEDLDGQTFAASSIGTKVKSRQEQINTLVATFVASGVEKEMALTLATAALDNPAALRVVEGGES